jgi:hypothetical protein
MAASSSCYSGSPVLLQGWRANQLAAELESNKGLNNSIPGGSVSHATLNRSLSLGS